MNFNLLGKTHVEIESFIILTIERANSLEAIFKTFGGIPSKPTAFLGFVLDSNFLISLSFTVLKINSGKPGNDAQSAVYSYGLKILTSSLLYHLAGSICHRSQYL